MSSALLCSGQGQQGRAMFDLFAGADAAAVVLAAAGEQLGCDPYALLMGAEDEALHDNRAGQILCVARALAAAACLSPTAPFLLAGYSVGEMAAWGIAGVWTSEQTLRLTALRAELMDRAGGANDGLGFVRGLDRDSVSELTAQFDCSIAIANPGRLFVIGGGRSDVARCCDQALQQGAMSARPIAVRVASHTPRVGAAVSPFEAALRAAGGQRPAPGRSLVGAANASLVISPEQGVGGLARQLASCVDWVATLEALVERGVDKMLELGPGTALAEMVRAAYPDVSVRALDDFRSLEGARAWMKG